MGRPLIFIEAVPDSYNLADRNHRVRKAGQMGIETLPAYYLTAEQTVRYLDSEDSYAKYLDYWNGKAFACNQMQHYWGMLRPIETPWKERGLEPEYPKITVSGIDYQ